MCDARIGGGSIRDEAGNAIRPRAAHWSAGRGDTEDQMLEREVREAAGGTDMAAKVQETRSDEMGIRWLTLEYHVQSPCAGRVSSGPSRSYLGKDGLVYLTNTPASTATSYGSISISPSLLVFRPYIPLLACFFLL